MTEKPSAVLTHLGPPVDAATLVRQKHAGTGCAPKLCITPADLYKANSAVCILAEGGSDKPSEDKSVRWGLCPSPVARWNFR